MFHCVHFECPAVTSGHHHEISLSSNCSSSSSLLSVSVNSGQLDREPEGAEAIRPANGGDGAEGEPMENPAAAMVNPQHAQGMAASGDETSDRSVSPALTS